MVSSSKLGICSPSSITRFPVLVISGAATVGVLVGAAPSLNAVAPHRIGQPVAGCSVVDGDTLRCDGERIRLLAIDAPELPGHCRKGRQCAPGDPYASTRSLKRALAGRLTIERVGLDRYGRTLAVLTSQEGNLSCWQLRHGQAVYKRDWDNGFRVARSCPSDIVR